MRLDASKGDVGYFVWDAEQCCHAKYVVWVDDDSNQWALYWPRPIVVNSEIEPPIIRQARKIAIYLDRRLIIINPIADDAPAEVIEAIGVAA